MTTDRPAPVVAAAAWPIAVISGTVLALELAFIRELPAEVRAISYFTNLVLMASFFGLGVGCMLERARSVAWLLPVGLVATAAFMFFTRGLVVYDGAQNVHYWLAHDARAGGVHELPVFAAAFLAFLSTALVFVGLGQRLASALNAQPRLTGYGWDILGSLLGTWAFVLASTLGVPPWLWPPVTMLLMAATVLPTWRSRALHVAAGALFLLFSQSTHAARWSPYYFVQHEQQRNGLRVWVNSSFHQLALNLDPRRADLADIRALATKKFGIPYDEYQRHHGTPPKRVLILGAGTGNDVNIALGRGAERVVAVEIDPVILALGREHNATHPYADPRVETVVDDARHYLHASHERFDLVVFGTLDSQTLLSGHANLRLENYVYTVESFRDVVRHLAPTGMLVAYYSIFKPWLVARLYRTICGELSPHCQVLRLDNPFLFDTIFLAGPGLPASKPPPLLELAAKHVLPSTDDWPFLYVEAPTIATVYLQLMAAVGALILGVFWLLRRGVAARGRWHFLFLGMGFTLLESAAVVRLSLLFGSTWVVNAVVFSAVLGMVFVANWAVLRDRAPTLPQAMLGLVLGVLLNYLLTPASLLGLPGLVRVAACTAAIGTPVLFAAVCFSRLFARERSTGAALGLNMIGAMAGGLAEYSSMLLGMRAVWLLVLAVYLCAILSCLRVSQAASALAQPAE